MSILALYVACSVVCTKKNLVVGSREVVDMIFLFLCIVRKYTWGIIDFHSNPSIFMSECSQSLIINEVPLSRMKNDLIVLRRFYFYFLHSFPIILLPVLSYLKSTKASIVLPQYSIHNNNNWVTSNDLSSFSIDSKYYYTGQEGCRIYLE